MGDKIVGLDELLNLPGAAEELAARGYVRAQPGITHWRMVALRVIVNALRAIPQSECKTIGNGHPEGLHCFACTFYDLLQRAERALKFWSEGERAKRACS